MSIENDVREWVESLPAMQEAGCSVYPLFAPYRKADGSDIVPPYATLRLAASPLEQTLDGGIVEPVELRLRLEIWADSYEQARELSQDVILAAADWSDGDIASVQDLAAVSHGDHFETSPELVVRQLYGRDVDLVVHASIE